MKVARDVLGMSLMGLGGIVLAAGFFAPAFILAPNALDIASQIKDSGVILIVSGLLVQISISSIN